MPAVFSSSQNPEKVLGATATHNRGRRLTVNDVSSPTSPANTEAARAPAPQQLGLSQTTADNGERQDGRIVGRETEGME